MGNIGTEQKSLTLSGVEIPGGIHTPFLATLLSTTSLRRDINRPVQIARYRVQRPGMSSFSLPSENKSRVVGSVPYAAPQTRIEMTALELPGSA